MCTFPAPFRNSNSSFFELVPEPRAVATLNGKAGKDANLARFL
jgi:hypothetical protein